MNQASSPGNQERHTQIRIVATPEQSNWRFSEIIARCQADVHARLLSKPPARIADLGCGSGATTVDLALAYAGVRIDGYDADGAAIETAWARARTAGVTDRVTFHVRSVTDSMLHGRYDILVCFLSPAVSESPQAVLDTVLRLIARGGFAVFVASMREAEHFAGSAQNAGFDCKADFTCLDALLAGRVASRPGRQFT